MLQINSVEALCLDITHNGIPNLMVHMTRSLGKLAVGQLICASYSTLADHQMIAADTDLQDGVSRFAL